MPAIGNGVSHRGLPVEAFEIAWNLASAITRADVGKAVSVDTSAARTVKLAADNDVVIGYLETVEDRVQEGIKVGTVGHKGGTTLTYSGTAPTVGGQVQGAGAGVVKTLTGVNARFPHVVSAVDTTALTVEVLFL